MTLIAIHILQNHAPSNLNRDDNGDPKDCIFGGFRRARISSQALKRSIRWSEIFRDAFADTPELLAQRTQLLPELVRHRIAELDLADEVKSAIVQQTARLGKGDSRSTPESGTAEGESTEVGKKTRKSKNTDTDTAQRVKNAQLMFLTTREVDLLAERMVVVAREKGLDAFGALGSDKLLEALGTYEPHAVDIAMFGRMTTSSPFKNVDAAVQVAHPLSTHAIEQEFDFYTAVDDISGEAGAGFIGETSFNSATYYKYMNMHWEELVKNVQGDVGIAQQTVHAFLNGALMSTPSGKQNSFAAHNLPDFALVEVLERNIPLSYANAFLKPVRAKRDESLMDASVAALMAYAGPLPTCYQLPVQRAIFATPLVTLPPLEEGTFQRCAHTGALAAWLTAHLPIATEA
jgi:CRISPR system Cascade subunit CasC